MTASRFLAVLVLVLAAALMAAQQTEASCPLPTRAGLPVAPKLARAAQIAATDTVVLSVQHGEIQNVSFVEDEKGQPMNAPAIKQALESWRFHQQFNGTCEVEFVWHVLPPTTNTPERVSFVPGQVEITRP